MAVVRVIPEEFHLVSFDAGRIAELAADVAARVGLAADVEMRIEVDETNPLGRHRLESVDPIVVAVQSGAFEHAKKPRQQSDESVVDVLGLLLFRAKDRLDPAFGDPPPDEELSPQQWVAWDAYCAGRADRAGLAQSKPRRRYHFRIRHGFSDVADATFDRLWSGEDLTWVDIEEACAETAAVASA